MKVTIKYFAMLKEQAGKKEEVFETSVENCEQLYELLQTQRGLKFPRKHLQVAVNASYVPFSGCGSARSVRRLTLPSCRAFAPSSSC